MKNMFRKLWNDDAGFIVSGEIVFLFTIVVIGLIVGWAHVRNAMVSELTEVANALLSVDQTYSYTTITGCNASLVTNGSATADTTDLLTFTQAAPTTQDITVNPCP